MILVTVGHSPWHVERLMRAVEELAQMIDEEIIVQRGNTSYKPKNTNHFQFASGKEMEELTSKARIVIAHAAAGASLLALKYQKGLILVPRLRKYKENYNDHQIQLAKALHDSGRAIWVKEPTGQNLFKALNDVEKIKTKEHKTKELVNYLHKLLKDWEEQTI